MPFNKVGVSCLFMVLFYFGFTSSQNAFPTSCDVVDVALLIDSSENMGANNFYQIKSFLSSFISVLNIDLSATRLTAVQAGPSPRTLWEFSLSSDKNSILRNVNSLRYTGGPQNLPLASNSMFSKFFSRDNGNREDVPDVAIIFVGGDAQHRVVSQMRDMKQTMRIIVVTVGIEADLHWKELVSDPFEKNFYNLDNAFHIIFLLQSPELAQCANHESDYLFIEEETTTNTNVISSEETSSSSSASQSRSTTVLNSSEASCTNGAWTTWFDNDDPDGLGDDESLWTLRSQYPGDICEHPITFEARVVSTKAPLNTKAESVSASHLSGLECLNYIGGQCEDYEIRFCCPTNNIKSTPSSVTPNTNEGASSETPALSSATTSTALNIEATAAATETPTSSRRPTCPPGFWSPWYNNDDANGYGENESLHVHRTRNPETLCEFPTAIEARVAGTLEPMQSVARNVFMSRITGLECLKMKGEPCVDHEVRFCCAPVLQCYVGSKSMDMGNNDQLKEVACSPGDLCSEVTATVTTNIDGESFTSNNSIGLCLPRNSCSNFSCDHLRGHLTSSSIIELRNCEARCCDENRCIEPRDLRPIQTTETPTPPEPQETGTKCFSGIEIGGSPELARYGVSNPEFNVVTCNLGEVCTTLQASPVFPRGRFRGTVLKKYQCLPPVACGSTNCAFVKSLLPKPFRITLENCSSSCCDWGYCNKPNGVVLPAEEQGNVAESASNSEGEGSRIITIRSTTPPPSIPTNTAPQTYSKKFLPKCTVSQFVSSVFWCESMLSTPPSDNGIDSCRNKIKNVARCVEKQVSWCAGGEVLGRLDSLKLPNFNSKMILKFLRELYSDSPQINNEINNFCFNAGNDFSFVTSVSTLVPGCHSNFLPDLREQVKRFFYFYSVARHKGDLCRAFGNFKRWFTLATYKMCTFTEMEQQGYSRKTTEYLKKIVQKAIRTLKTLKPLSCKKQKYRL